MQTRVMWRTEFPAISICGSFLLVVLSACSGAGKTSSGNDGPDDGGNPSPRSGASGNTPSDSGSHATGAGGRAAGSGGTSAGGAGNTGGGGRTSSGGTTSTGTATGGASPSGTGGATSQCDADRQTVSNDYQMALSNADLSCTTDAECVEGPTSACDFVCQAPVVSRKGAGRLQASIDDSAAACARVQMQGCSSGPVPCIVVIGTPACLSGMCRRFIPVAWSSVSFADPPTPFVTCDDASACEVWSVYPDGRVTDAPPGGTPRTAMLLPPEIERVTTIVESVSFRQGLFDGFPCTAAASPHRPIMLARDDPSGNHSGQSVEDCIYGGPANNDVHTLWTLAHDAFAPDAGP